MAYSQETYEIMAGALGAMPGLTEKKMFGGICFLLNGNMLAGVMKNGAMARVGKERESRRRSPLTGLSRSRSQGGEWAGLSASPRRSWRMRLGLARFSTWPSPLSGLCPPNSCRLTPATGFKDASSPTVRRRLHAGLRPARRSDPPPSPPFRLGRQV